MSIILIKKRVFMRIMENKDLAQRINKEIEELQESSRKKAARNQKIKACATILGIAVLSGYLASKCYSSLETIRKINTAPSMMPEQGEEFKYWYEVYLPHSYTP